MIKIPDFRSNWTYSIIFDNGQGHSHIRARVLHYNQAIAVARLERAFFTGNIFRKNRRGKALDAFRKNAIQIWDDCTGKRLAYPDGSWV